MSNYIKKAQDFLDLLNQLFEVMEAQTRECEKIIGVGEPSKWFPNFFTIYKRWSNRIEKLELRFSTMVDKLYKDDEFDILERQEFLLKGNDFYKQYMKTLNKIIKTISNYDKNLFDIILYNDFQTKSEVFKSLLVKKIESLDDQISYFECALSVQELRSEFEIEQTVENNKFPGKDGKEWIVNQKIDAGDLSIKEPDSKKNSKILVEYEIHIFNVALGKIIIKAELSSCGYSESFFISLKGFSTPNQRNKAKIENFLKTIKTSYDTSLRNKTVLGWKIGQIKDLSELGIQDLKGPETSVGEMTFKVSKVNALNGVVEISVIVTNNKYLIFRSKNIKISKFTGLNAVFKEIRIYLGSFTEKQPLDLKNRVSINDSWENAIHYLKQGIPKKELYKELINKLEFGAPYKPITTLLKDDGVKSSSDYKKFEISYVEEETQKTNLGEFIIYFKNIDLDPEHLQPIVIKNIDKTISVIVGATWDHQTSSTEIVLIKKFHKIFKSWWHFMEKYKKIEIVDFAFKEVSDMENIEYEKIHNKYWLLDEKMLGLELDIYERNIFTYLGGQSIQMWMELHLTENDELIAKFVIYGSSRNENYRIYSDLYIHTIKIT